MPFCSSGTHCLFIVLPHLDFDSIFISVEDRTRRIRFSYNYSMSFTQRNKIITKQTGDTFYTGSYRL